MKYEFEIFNCFQQAQCTYSLFCSRIQDLHHVQLKICAEPADSSNTFPTAMSVLAIGQLKNVVLSWARLVSASALMHQLQMLSIYSIAILM